MITITTPGGYQESKGLDISVRHDGVLTISDKQGECCATFAPGAWLSATKG